MVVIIGTVHNMLGCICAVAIYVVEFPQKLCKGYESDLHKVPENNGLIFHIGEVSELWRKIIVNNSHVFNLSNCAVAFRM